MEIKVKSYSSQSSLLSSILFFIIGAILLTSADKVIEMISIIIGVLLAVVGIINLVIYIHQVKHELPASKNNITVAVVTLILAFIFIFFSSLVEQFIRFIVGAWILLTGITRFINVLSMSTKSRKFIPLLTISILLMVVGVYTIVIGNIILAYIGLIMMIYAVIEIAGYIFYTKDTVTPEEPGTTTLIVPEESSTEETKKESKNIKDVKETKSKKKAKKSKDKDEDK